ncbi:class I SAM-dependent methyltransferase [Asaia krungthepensis]|uniref:50S ribosomal protein L11 methyltransferase n=1 Tax=Asaia krungthepensis NRIC 0535 TaxID=1307925 RepID=A0ABQ0Q5A0_9PROT|nr:50S ribosomal protein L11 methyltransferase [Asaia krungthepensis]GBQ92159.1 50S ribosomal protein L11 methyltransferase [Asaia krungthepensis NRIC 0535]
MKDPRAFISSQTVIAVAPLVPEIELHLATEITPIWQATEAHLAALNIEPPFWAFAWPGSQLLARFVLDQPERVRDRSVLDFACGGGLAGIACAQAGARAVRVNDIDPLALEAACLNAALNKVSVVPVTNDLVGTVPEGIDLLLCGDVCYNQQMADRIIPWLRRCARTMDVWMADPGRPYAPKDGIEILISATLPTTMELEGKTARETRLCRILPSSG